MAPVHRCRRVLAVTTRAPLDCHPFALLEYLESVGSDPCSNLLTGKTVGHEVKVLVDIDMLIEASPAYLPLSEDISFDRSGRRTG